MPMELIETSKKRLILWMVFGWLGFSVTHAQDLKITEVFRQGDFVHIVYDLYDTDVTHKYQISLYSSLDDYVVPLTAVEGAIGVDIAIGGNKEVIWNVRKEYGDAFQDVVSLELKGKLYIPFVTLNDFEDFKEIKRDRPYLITWQAGRGSNVLTWDLYNSDNEKVHTFTNVANAGEYEMIIPRDVKPGKGYSIRISDQNNKEDLVITPTFELKRKIPLYVPSTASGITLGAVFFLANFLQNTQDTEPEEIPIPDLPFN